MNTPRVRPNSAATWFRRRLLPAGLAAMLTAIPASATSVVPPEFDQLVGQSDYIVRAVVRSVTSELRTSGAHRHIVTKVELEVRAVISGTPPQPLVLEMLGGRVGGEEMKVEGAPRFTVGDEDILFVHGNGRLFTPLVALGYGRYPILRDAASGREYVTRSDGSLLTSEREVARPMAGRAAAAPAAGGSAQALSPTEFIDRIRAAVARSTGRPPLQR